MVRLALIDTICGLVSILATRFSFAVIAKIGLIGVHNRVTFNKTGVNLFHIVDVELCHRKFGNEKLKFKIF